MATDRVTPPQGHEGGPDHHRGQDEGHRDQGGGQPPPPELEVGDGPRHRGRRLAGSGPWRAPACHRVNQPTLSNLASTPVDPIVQLGEAEDQDPDQGVDEEVADEEGGDCRPPAPTPIGRGSSALHHLDPLVDPVVTVLASVSEVKRIGCFGDRRCSR